MTPEQAALAKTLLPPEAHWGGLGALPLNPDPKDYPFHLLEPAAAIPPEELPKNFSLLQYVKKPPYNQGAEGSCVPNSTCGDCTVGHSQADGSWPIYAAHALYSELGGTGQNGIDTRICLQRCVDAGTPKTDGTREKVIRSYVFIDRNAATFRQQIKAAIVSGHPVLVAALLPIPFSWNTGMVLSSGYHQFLGMFYETDSSGKEWLGILNSWGPSWPGDAPAGTPPGVGRISFDALEQNNLQAGYCYAVVPTALDISPPPPPPPPLITSALIEATATGPGVGGLRVADKLRLTSGLEMVLSKVQLQSGPPPPPSILTVSGYVPNPAKSGQPFQINGSGFQGGNLTASWQGGTLVAQRLSDTQIQATAPSVTTSASGPVTVRVEGATADGPPLTVTVDSQPLPGSLQVKLYPRRRSAMTVTLLAYIYRDGTPETATITGSIGATVLETRQAQIGSWTVTGLPPGSQAITVNARSANGNGTATALI